MIVKALIPLVAVSDRLRALPMHLQAITVAYFREQRAARHAQISRFLADPTALDAVLPGLATLPPGPGNDRLRALRYSDDARFGLSKMGTDPDQLRAALVAQRIRCWRALRPTEAFAARTCRYGQGSAACRFLGFDEAGWLCAKNTPLAASISKAIEAGLLTARGDNCSGRSAR